MIHAHTEESFLLDFSDFKLIEPLKRSLTETFEPKVLKKIISFLEIEETIALRSVNKVLKQHTEDYLKDLTELSIYFYETTKVFSPIIELILSLKTDKYTRRSQSYTSWGFSPKDISFSSIC